MKHTLKRSLPGRRPTLRQVARELCLSVRSLQRRLTDADLTFQQVVEETRREVAHHYLKHSTMELHEAAFLLGYGDANSFFRAFQGWEGTTPGEWRTRHRAAHAEALANWERGQKPATTDFSNGNETNRSITRYNTRASGLLISHRSGGRVVEIPATDTNVITPPRGYRVKVGPPLP